MKFREDKTTQAAARFLSLGRRQMKHMKLLKLLYLLDREALIRWGRPVTFDYYVSMPHGPVLSFTLNLINSPVGSGQTDYWHSYISERNAHEVKLVKNAPTDQLSPAEERLIEEVFGQYGKRDQWALVDHCHTLPEWRDPEGSSLPIQIRDILRAGGRDDDEIEAIQDALEGEADADRLIGG